MRYSLVINARFIGIILNEYSKVEKKSQTWRVSCVASTKYCLKLQNTSISKKNALPKIVVFPDASEARYLLITQFSYIAWFPEV